MAVRVGSHQVRSTLYVGYLALAVGVAGIAILLLAFGGSSGTDRPAAARAATGHTAAPAPVTTVPNAAVNTSVGTSLPRSAQPTTPAASTATTLVSSSSPSSVATTATTTSSPPIGTTYLPVAPGSGAGCTAGITEGNHWVKYTVQAGDNLSEIARCFDLNGYQAIYDFNSSVIGSNPNLIYRGQVITIVNGVMTVKSSS